ncbi:MAG TPA: TetR family transcriptional regulator [Spirochaetota bacterium]|nr:TetR family transcriptional regulator [Spirochaetota bacterium]
MAPKTIFSREDIINAALEIVKKSGFRDFSARKIADEMNASTAPVYSCFSSMDQLKTAVLQKAEELMLEYTMKPYTKSVFLNMGTGLVLFSQENRELFRALLLESGETRALLKNFLRALIIELDRDELISLLPKNERKEVMNRMAIFTHGFASLICVGILDEVSRKEAIKTMYDMGRDVIESALAKAGIKHSLTEQQNAFRN